MPSKSLILGQSLFNIANGVAQYVPNGIQNPRAGMWIDELRFLVSMTPVAGVGAYNAQTILHDAIRIQVKVGKTELTSGFVGASIAAGVRDWSIDAGLALAETTDVGNVQAFGVGAFCWRFPKPMYLPENGVLDIAVQQQDDLGFPAKTLNVDIAALCREVPRGQEPKTTDVPFVANWFGAPVNNPGATNNPGNAGTVLSVVASSMQQSTSHDLRNRFRVPLRVTRFTATQWANANFEAPGTPTLNQSGPEVNAWVGGGAALVPALNNNIGQDSPLFQPTMMQIFDQDGQPIVRDQSSPGAIFAYADRAWRVDSILPPNGYFLVDANVVTTSAYRSSRLAVGMVGYRTIPVSDLGVAE
jgi:hypothetical protein